MRKQIFQEIETERAYQDSKWGNAFDDKNTINDWTVYIIMYLGKAVKMGITKEEQRIAILKAATLCIAALETTDRNNGFARRHYD